MAGREKVEREIIPYYVLVSMAILLIILCVPVPPTIDDSIKLTLYLPVKKINLNRVDGRKQHLFKSRLYK